MKSFFSFLLISIFSILFSLSLFAYDLKLVFLNPETIKESLVKNNAYESVVTSFLPTVVLQALKNNGADSENAGTLAQKVSIKLVDPKSLQQDTETILDHLLPYLDGKTQTLAFSLDLTKYKKTLENNFETAFLDYFSSLPLCDPGGEKQESEGLPSCRAEGTTLAQLYQQIPAQEIRESLLDRFPAEVKIDNNKATLVPSETTKGEAGHVSPNPSQDLKSIKLNSIRDGLGKANLFILLGFSLSLLSLCLVALLWLKNYRSSLRWISRGLFTTAFVPLLISLAIFLFLSKNFLLSTIDRFFGLPAGIDIGPLVGVVLYLLKSFSFLLLLEAIVMIVISIGITLFLKFYRPSGKSLLRKTP
ncbi:MAG: hypothetical protein Q8P13_04275 [bacterium]|nr:hypothetical protein [bacterium]